MDAREADRLIWLYQDGRLDEAGEKKLALLVRNDPAFARRFSELSLLDAAMHKCLNARQQQLHASRRPLGDEGRMRAKRRSRRHPSRAAARPIRWGRWISVAACLAIVAGALVYNGRQEKRFTDVMVAQIQRTAPGVEIHRRGGTVIATVGMDLFAGDRIETKKGEKLVLGYPKEKTAVTIGDAERETTLTIGDVTRGKRLHLEKGILDASVDPQPEDKPFIVATPHAEAKVVGTAFTVRIAGRATWLEVREGAVELTRLADGESIKVAAGQFSAAGENADDYALNAYRIGTEWVDGPVILKDDFSRGMGNWVIVLRRGDAGGDIIRDGIASGPDGTAARYEEKDASIGVEGEDWAGRPCPCVRLRNDGANYSGVYLSLRPEAGWLPAEGDPWVRIAFDADLALDGRADYGGGGCSLTSTRSSRSEWTAWGGTGGDTTDDVLGTVTAQGDYEGAREGVLKAFDNLTSTKWLDFANANPGTRASWIQYAYAGGARKTVAGYTLTSANDAPARDPRDWRLLGTNDGGQTWAELDLRTGEQFSARFQRKEYTVANPGAYATYRLRIESVREPSGANAVQLAEIELLETVEARSPSSVSATTGVHAAADGVGGTTSETKRETPTIRPREWVHARSEIIRSRDASGAARVELKTFYNGALLTARWKAGEDPRPIGYCVFLNRGTLFVKNVVARKVVKAER